MNRQILVIILHIYCVSSLRGHWFWLSRHLLQLVVVLQSFIWNLVFLYVAPSGAVIMYEPLCCRMFLTIAGYHNLFADILYITCVLRIIHCWKFEHACNMFATCPTCFLPACYIGRSDLVCLAHTTVALRIASHYQAGCLYTASQQSGVSTCHLGFCIHKFHNCTYFSGSPLCTELVIWSIFIPSIDCLN